MQTESLAHVYNDPGPFASVYLNASRDVADGDRVLDRQLRSAVEQLNSAGAPAGVVEELAARLAQPAAEPAPVSRLVVATERGVVLDELSRARTPRLTATWGVLPDLADWISDEDGSIPFVLAVVNHEGGDVSVFRSDALRADEEVSVGAPDEHEHKVRGGGWSHLRFQHVAENVWARNARAVAEVISRQVQAGIRLVLVAGDVQSRAQVREAIGEDLQADVVELESGTRSADGSDDALQAAVLDVLVHAAAAAKLAAVHELQERLGRDYAVAVGVADLMDAFVRGQVDRLLLDPVAARESAVHPKHHPGLVLGAMTELPDSIPADQALVAAAVLTGAEVIITRARTLGGAPAAGLLRWDQASVGTRA